MREFSTEELLDIVEHSQRFNTSRGLTGMLLHKGGSFMQVLEGPAPEVEALMAKIGRDSRHSGLMTLLTRPIEERQFADWSMGFRDLNTLSSWELKEFGPYLSSSLASDLFQKEPTAALKLLRHFKEQMR